MILSRYLCVPAIFSLILLCSENILSIISVPLHVLISVSWPRGQTVCPETCRVHLTITWFLCCWVACPTECWLGEVSRLVLVRASMLSHFECLFILSVTENQVFNPLEMILNLPIFLFSSVRFILNLCDQLHEH